MPDTGTISPNKPEKPGLIAVAKEAIASPDFYYKFLQVVVVGVLVFYARSTLELLQFREQLHGTLWTLEDHYEYTLDIDERLFDMERRFDARLDKIDSVIGAGVPPPQVIEDLHELKEEQNKLRELVNELRRR